MTIQNQTQIAFTALVNEAVFDDISPITRQGEHALIEGKDADALDKIFQPSEDDEMSIADSIAQALEYVNPQLIR